MRSEAFAFPLVREEMGKLPGGRWLDQQVLDDAISDIAVAELQAAAAKALHEETGAALTTALDAVVVVRRALMRLVDDAIRPTPRP